MLLCTVQALGELAVLFPVNGAFYTYIVRFVDPSLYILLLRKILARTFNGIEKTFVNSIEKTFVNGIEKTFVNGIEKTFPS
jgi:hypothetical protein